MQRRRRILLKWGMGWEGDFLAWLGLEELSQSVLPVNSVLIEELIMWYFLLERFQHIVFLTHTYKIT